MGISGWLMDTYPDYQLDLMVSWIKRADGGTERIVERFSPSFFIRGEKDRLKALARELKEEEGVSGLAFEEHCLSLGQEKRREVLKVTVGKYKKLKKLAEAVEARGHYRDFSLYNVDLRFCQRYYLPRGIFPFARVDVNRKFELRDERWDIDYPLPVLKKVQLQVEMEKSRRVPSFAEPIKRIRLGDVELCDPDELALLLSLAEELERLDPDIIYTEGGDSFLLPYLYHRTNMNRMGHRFQLGREADPQTPQAQGKSYFTYGQIKYKPPYYALRGRIHIDTHASFLNRESGLYGLLDMARLSGIPLQSLSRYSSGTAISAMQVTQAIQDGVLVHWKKAMPEGFKTGMELLRSDRGGSIMDPIVGVHGNVVEVDFASLYPNIMVTKNISPETLLCGCCPDSGIKVPELHYHTCEKRLGLIPRVLEPIIARRMECKRRLKAGDIGGGDDGEVDGEGHEQRYEEIQKLLKWVLVTCFGYTGYKNARFGRIECHESITAWGRELILQARETAEGLGYEVLHGIVDSLWLKAAGDDRAPASPTELCESISERTGITMELEGVYRWIVFLPNRTNNAGALNRYYGVFQDGSLKVRGVELRQRSTPPLFCRVQEEVLGELAKAKDAEGLSDAVPKAVELLKGWADRIRTGECDIWDMLFSIRVSKKLEEYKVLNEQVAALVQLQREGVAVNPGQAVRYLVMDSSSREPSAKVRVDQLLTGSESYDIEHYTKYLARVGASLLMPFGWDEKALLQEFMPGYQDRL